MRHSERSRRCEGVNLFFADGKEAFQEIFHSHLHVIPHHRGDGFSIDAFWRRRSGEPPGAPAASIRDALISAAGTSLIGENNDEPL